MGTTINIPRQGGNADFGALQVALEPSHSLTRYIVADNSGKFYYSTASAGGGGGSGSVTNVSVVTANGFAGTVTSPTISPAITIKTTISGLIKGDGTAISAATAGTDYISSTVGTASWAQNVITSSRALQANTASYILLAASSSYALSASYSQTSSYTSEAISSSYALTASYALNGGGSSGASYTHTQASPSTTWTINHNLDNLYPAVTIYDGNGYVIIPQNIQSVTVDQTIVTFSYPAVGYATLVVQGITTAAIIPLALTSSFTSSSATNAFYNTVYENRLLVDCSTGTFFTWTGSYNTQSFYFSSSFVTGSTTSASALSTIPLPFGGAKGDIYLVGVGSRTGVPSPPSGWTIIDNTTNGNTNSLTMYLVQTSSTVPSNPTITGPSANTVAFALLVRNANTSSFFARSGSSAGNTGMPTFSPITSSAANTLVVGMGYINSSVTNISEPTGSSAGFTLIASGSLGTTITTPMTAMVAFKITGSAQVNPGKFIGGGSGRPGVSGSVVTVTVAFPSISGSISLPKAVAFTNFPVSQSYEMTHLVQVETTSSVLWTNSLNSYNVTWPGNVDPYYTPGRTSIYKLLTINGGNNIYGQTPTDEPPIEPQEYNTPYLISSSNDYYTTQGRLTIDCSADTFFTYTASYVTKSLNYTASLVSASVFNFFNSSSLAFPLPSGSQKGDLYLIGATTTNNAVTASTGWTVITSSLINVPNLNDTAFSLFYLIQTGSTPPIDPTVSFGTTTTSDISVGFSLLIRNINTATISSPNPPDVTSYVVSASSVNGSAPDPPPIITPSSNNFGIAIGFVQEDVTDISTVTGFTLVASGSFRSPVGSIYRAVMVSTINYYVSGAVNPGIFGGTYTTGRNRGISLAFTSITGSQAFSLIPTFANIPSYQAYESTHLVKTIDENSLVWDSNIYWPGGNNPYLSGSTTSLLKFTTIDGGNSILGESSLNYPTF
jgi:hypothetical protein